VLYPALFECYVIFLEKVMNIEELELTIRSNTWLRAHGINSIDQLRAITFSEMQSIPKIGQMSVMDITWSMLRLLNGEIAGELERCQKLIESRHELHRFKEFKEKARKLDRIKSLI
jgi:DNA-directed RNA polymerase alpha subunit